MSFTAVPLDLGKAITLHQCIGGPLSLATLLCIILSHNAQPPLPDAQHSAGREDESVLLMLDNKNIPRNLAATALGRPSLGAAGLHLPSNLEIGMDTSLLNAAFCVYSIVSLMLLVRMSDSIGRSSNCASSICCLY